MTESSKGRLRRVAEKLGEKLGDKVADWFVVAVLAVAGAWAWFAWKWIANEWACIRKPWCEVQGWSLGVLIAATVATTLAAAYLGCRLYVARRELHSVRTVLAVKTAKPPLPPPFRQITVEDERLKLRWFVRKPPSAWLHWRDVAGTITPAYVHETLDGPFHAVPGCNAPLQVTYSHSMPVLSQRCPSCGEQIFRGRTPESGWGEEPVNPYNVRAQALEELQRMERNGTALNDDVPIVLERPVYWNVMLPLRAVKPQKK